jgi:VanZ family protein
VRTWKQWLPVALWAGLILWSANDDFSASNTGGWLRAIFGEVPYVLHVLIRKATHVVVYAILGFLIWRADRRAVVILGVALLVASADEWLQSRALNRTGTPWDVLLDLCGAALPVLLQRARHLRHQRARTDAH